MPDRYPPGPDHTIFQAARSTLRQQHDRLGFLIDIAQTYGDLVHFRTGLRHIYLLVQPDDVRSVLLEQADKFYKTRPFKHTLGKFLGEGLFVLDGEEHRRKRRLAQPAFHHRRIEAYAGVMVEHAQHLIDRWRDGQDYDIAEEMMRLTAGIVARTLFNADVSQDTEAIGQSMTVLQDAAMARFRRIVQVPAWLPTRHNRRIQHASQSLDEIVFRIIGERRSTGIDKGDLLSMLLLAHDQDGESNSAQHVHDEVITMFVAGHETTSNTLTWAWYLLTQHPAAIENLHRELDEALQGRTPTIADIERLPYTAMIVKETLRLFPPAWIITREAITDVTIGGYTLGAGSVVVTSPYITHRHPRYYPDPEQFRPERFAPGYEQSLPRFAYFPFSGGPRVCIGQSFAMMETILILATVAQQVEFTLCPDQKIEMDPLITLRARNGMRMLVAKRQG